jgi:S1-C subfamily serine protease
MSSTVKLLSRAVEFPAEPPWARPVEVSWAACACVIPGQRLLTNAHAVTSVVSLSAVKIGEERAFSARVMQIDHERELALVTVDDSSFWDGLSELRLGEIPPVGAKVRVESVTAPPCIARTSDGLISDLAVVTYRHSMRSLPAIRIQIPSIEGISGAPALLNNELIGIAFQARGNEGVEFIPSPMISAFLQDATDDRMAGVPELGVLWQPLVNRALRDYLSNEKAEGVLVTAVIEDSSADGSLRPRDVLTHIDGHKIDNRGFIGLFGTHLHFSALISHRRIGESIEIVFQRGKDNVTRLVALKPEIRLIRSQPGFQGRFVMLAGLVFMALTHEFMWSRRDSPDFHRYVNYANTQLPQSGTKEIVVLAQVIPHPINEGYRDMVGARILTVNDIPIAELKDVHKGLAYSNDGYHVIKTDVYGWRDSPSGQSEYGNLIVFHTSEALRVTSQIMNELDIVTAESLP